ncbi:Lipoprotein-releasing system transmembrane protein LolE [Enhygromyxa salina]|uniref:Lipoprotein-releasing system transmembrane protein LolE n=1 Tax=Enhygromyxa salina TaxID=215803 RepID=A0A2S9YHR4_9BACT|nr:ABC transporter permease [Enhygromyxa salina]PRQ04655.1 Lipoprotein-releasing system transmembrane protein LolE [Enhygromyxa salina]
MSRGEVREHPALLLLYVFALTTPLILLPDMPAWAEVLSWFGGVSLGLLLLRLVLVGFTGYERLVGLRIIRRKGEQSPTWRRSRFWLMFFWSTAALGLVALLIFNHVVDRDDGAMLELFKPLRVWLVFYVAAASFAGLLVLIAQRFSVFGTTSIIGVVLGVAALLVVQSVATGFQHEFERRVLGVYAHINVTRAFGISEYRRFEGWLRTLPGVEGASPFVYYAMALAPHTDRGHPTEANASDVKLASVLVKGIEPRTADQVIDLPQHLERGSGRVIPLSDLRSDYELMPVPDRPDGDLPQVIAQSPDPRGAGWYDAAINAWTATDHQDDPFRLGRARIQDDVWEDPPEDLGAITIEDQIDKSSLPTMFIGVGLARELKLGEGDVVRLVDPGATFDHSEEPKFIYYLIAGVFQAGFQEYDSRLVYVDIKELQRFKYRGKDIVSGVDLRLADQDLAPEVGASIRAALNGEQVAEYSVLEWQKLNENLFSSIRTQKNIITVILSLVIFVASFNVLSALWTMVIRRTPEVAIIMSMGATGPQVARIFQVTGMTIGLAGSLAGVVFGLVMCWLVQLYGYTLDPEVYFIEQLPVEISLVQIAWILGLSLVFCFIATIPPSLRAARLRPVEGLRYE